MKKVIIMLIMSLLALTRAGAQYYDTGQDPASLRWMQIRTSHFRIIFPEDFGSEARRYATLLEDSYERLSAIYPGVRTNVPVIIHNHSMQSNGYVSWAPRRMELFPLPGQDNLPLHPATQLAVHETAHVLQLGSLNQEGLGRVLRWLTGEQAVALSAVEIPLWAFEGEAVYAETVTGLSGRGRSNAFIRGARALATSPGGLYGYDKMLAGSYKNFTPDHYVFGYLMINHLRRNDPDTWQTMTSGIFNSWYLNPVNAGLRNRSGLTKKRLYDSTFASLETLWNEYIPDDVRDYPSLNVPRRKDYISHFTPHRLADGKIISLRTSMSDPSRFVITDPINGTEHNVTTTGYLYPYFFSCSDSTIVWAEQHPDIRWDNRDYSVIKRLNLPAGKVTQLTYKTRYAAPDLSPDGRTIAAVSTTPDMRCSLVFIDAYNGEVLMNVVPPDSLILQRPAWSSDGSSVTVVTVSEKGEGIRTYRPTGKRWITEKEESVTDIVQAEIFNDTLFFLAQDDGSDNIYRIAGEGAVERVTASRYGISGFSIRDGELLFSDYTAAGFIIASEKTSATAGPAGVTGHAIIPALAPLPSPANEEDRPPAVIPDPVRYRKIGHLFNFHSWFPFYADIDEIKSDPTAVRPGLTLLSQNHLSTLISTAGYEYSGGNHYLHTGIRWKGWHPVIDAEMRWGGDQLVGRDTIEDTLPDDLGHDLNLSINVYDQLWFAYGRFRQMIMPAVYFSYRNSYTFIPDENRFDKDLLTVTGRFYFSNTFRMAYRDINPRWGQVLDLRVTGTPWDPKLYNNRSYARATLFFPGLLHNHSFFVKAGWENQSPAKKLIYRNSIPWPRGFDSNLIAEKLFSFSADYTLPILYPDLAAGSLLYIKRIRGSLFYDYSRGERINDYSDHIFTPGKEVYTSAGSELLADFYVLRFPFEISAGIRAGYIPREQRYFVNGAFSVNIYGTVLGRER